MPYSFTLALRPATAALTVVGEVSTKTKDFSEARKETLLNFNFEKQLW